jgi:hypothetical protein
MSSSHEPKTAAATKDSTRRLQDERCPYTPPTITNLGKLATLTLGSAMSPGDVPLGSSA